MRSVRTFVDNVIMNNTYLLIDDQRALLIDPSFNVKPVMEYIAEHNLELKAILLTHGHYDHTGHLDELCQFYRCDYYVSPLDVELLVNPMLLKTNRKPVVTKPKLFDEIAMTIGGFDLLVYPAPGHSKGCVLIAWDDHLFTGDVLFYHDIGRTDLHGSSAAQMKSTLQFIATLNPKYKVYPGHEDLTDLQEELLNNPYLNIYY